VPVFPIWNRPEALDMDLALRQHARALVIRCVHDAIRSIALFGAGSHTQKLLPLWEQLGGPTIRLLVTSEQPQQHELECKPLVSVDAFDAESVDALVISSKSHEDALFKLATSRWPELPVYGFWKSSSLSQAALFRALVPVAIHTCLGAHHQDITVFGPPGPGSAFIRRWQALGGPDISCLVLPGSAAITKLSGVPCIPFESFDATAAKLILVLSAGYHDELYCLARSAWPKDRLLFLADPCASAPRWRITVDDFRTGRLTI
jgi:hypothetical protein